MQPIDEFTSTPTTFKGFRSKSWQVHKFGGTSVANAGCYRTVASIVEDLLTRQDAPDQLCIVVSAMGGKPKTTDLLLQTVEAAASRDTDHMEDLLQQILQKHTDCVDDLFGTDEANGKDEAGGKNLQSELRKIIAKDLTDIRDILKTVSLMKWQASRIQELVSGYGELWSAQILSWLLQERQRRGIAKNDSSTDLVGRGRASCQYEYIDARRIITIDEEAIQDGAMSWDMSASKLEAVYTDDTHMVVTGYVASNTHGVATTLQRDGSDYSAAIMGKLLRASRISIWTDVDGVLSADPRRVPSAQVLTDVSYNEAMELAYFGAKVIHPKTMQPAISSKPQIPIYIRNTFHPQFPGTRIFTSSTTHTDRDKCVCGFSSIEHMALINVEGPGLVGVHGVAKRLFGALEEKDVNVVLISQASSEHSITFATLEKESEDAKAAIEEEFHKEIRAGRVSDVDLQTPCSIIAAVGDGMSSTAGVSGRFFSALGDARINVLAIAQGCSERNISAVVRTSESTLALQAVHAAFRLSHATVRVGIVGMNEIGESLMKLFEMQRHKLRSRFDIDVQVVAVLKDGDTSEVVCLNDDKDGGMDSVSLDSYSAVATDTGTKPTRTGTSSSKPMVGFEGGELAKTVDGGLSVFLQRLLNESCSHHIVFDCTAEAKLGALHADWLRAGVHVVTANNSGLSGPLEQRAAILEAETAKGKLSAQYLREVTVGGALPIISTLRKLRNSGDRIRRVDGILSVSMSFILHRISPPQNFGASSKFDQESSPSSNLNRDGIDGLDNEQDGAPVSTEPCSFSEAVKEAIERGLMEEDPISDLNNEYSSKVLLILAKELELDHQFVKDEIQQTSEKLVDGLHPGADFAAFDRQVQERLNAVHARGCVLRHIASVDVKSQTIDIRLVEVPNGHVFAVTPPSCECVRFFTQRHRNYPLIVQGPAAGADSTASALLAELLTLMRSKVGPRSGNLSRSTSLIFQP